MGLYLVTIRCGLRREHLNLFEDRQSKIIQYRPQHDCTSHTNARVVPRQQHLLEDPDAAEQWIVAEYREAPYQPQAFTSLLKTGRDVARPHAFEYRIKSWASRSKPYQHFVRERIDAARELHLRASFLDISLIDAQCVDPECSWLISIRKTQVSQRTIEVRPGGQSMAVQSSSARTGITAQQYHNASYCGKLPRGTTRNLSRRS